MFGLLDALYGHLQRHLGARTDAADPAGSLNAKASDIRNQVGSNADAASTSGTVHAKLKAIPLSPIKSIQRGTFQTSNTGSNTITISSINPAKAFVILNGKAGSYSDGTDSYNYYLSGMTSTSITVSFSNYNYLSYISYQVIEYV